jgi:hypothetical protein
VACDGAFQVIAVKSQMENKLSPVAGFDNKLHMLTIYFTGLNLRLLVLSRARTPAQIGSGLFQNEKCGVMLGLAIR